LRFSDIKVGYIYFVIFDPVRDCEFNGQHLALVLKKNNDGKTFIVMPLSSAANGEGINKYHVGSLTCLPSSLRSNDTYAVFNQIQTVNSNRFIALKEGNNVIECMMDKVMYYTLLKLAMHEIVFSIPQDDRIDIFKKMYEEEKVLKAKDIAYVIKGSSNITQAERIQKLIQIKELLQGVSFLLPQKYIDDGIGILFDEAKNY